MRATDGGAHGEPKPANAIAGPAKQVSVALVTTYFPPQNSAGANRLLSLARQLKRAGFECAVFAPTYGASPPVIDAELAVSRRAVPIRRRDSFLHRFIDETRAAVRLLMAARGRRATAYLITTPFLSCLLFAPLVLLGRRLIFDVRDLSWEYAIDTRPHIRFAQLFLSIWAKWALHSAELVCASTSAEVEYLARVVGGDKVMLVTNGVEESYARALCQLDNDDDGFRLKVFYAGTLGRAQGVGIFAELAAAAPDVEFEAAGEGIERDEMQRAIQIRSLKNLTLPGHLAPAELLERYRRAGVLFLRLRPGFATAVPSKTYEYAATGLPIVYMGSEHDACWETLRAFEGVRRVNDGDIEDALRAIRQCLAACTRSAENLERVVQRYTREAQGAALARALHARLGPSSPMTATS